MHYTLNKLEKKKRMAIPESWAYIIIKKTCMHADKSIEFIKNANLIQ